MSTKKFLAFGKVLILLLLVSFSVSAKDVVNTNEHQEQGKLSFNEVENAFHKNMLQPQVVHVTVTTEHTVKPVNPSWFVSFFTEKRSLELRPGGQTNLIIQDANRCESVSRLLFPFHYFW